MPRPRGPAPPPEGSGLGCPQTATAGSPWVQGTINSRGSPTARPRPVPETAIGVGGGRHCGVGAPQGRPWALGPCALSLSCHRPRDPRPALRPEQEPFLRGKGAPAVLCPAQDARAAARRGPVCPGAPPGSAWMVPCAGRRLPACWRCPGRDQPCRTGVAHEQVLSPEGRTFQKVTGAWGLCAPSVLRGGGVVRLGSLRGGGGGAGSVCDGACSVDRHVGHGHTVGSGSGTRGQRPDALGGGAFLAL